MSDIQFATTMLNAKVRGYGYFSIDEERSDTKGPWIDVAVDQRERRLSFSLKFFSYFFRRPFSPAVLSLLFPPLVLGQSDLLKLRSQFPLLRINPEILLKALKRGMDKLLSFCRKSVNVLRSLLINIIVMFAVARVNALPL